MRAELAVAEEQGRALSFALGCLLAAGRALPAQREGRFALASYALALCVVMPLSALLLLAAATGYPYVAEGQRSPLNDGEVALVPALMLLMLALALAQSLFAWFVVERAWMRAISATLFGAAASATLAPLTALLSMDVLPELLLLVVLATETAALLALARWQARFPGAVVRPSG